MTRRVAHNLGKLLLLAAVLMVVTLPIAFSQESEIPPRMTPETAIKVSEAHTFEVASIRPNKAGGFSRWENTPDGLIGKNQDLQTIIVLAYDLRDPNLRGMTHEKALRGGQIETIPGGPSWINRVDRYDIQARMSESDVAELKRLSPQQQAVRRREMVQALLADRFKLKVHYVSREIPCYALVMAKDGPKNMKKVPDDAERKWEWSGWTDLKAKATTVTDLTETVLAFRLECPISDKTGLTGKYDFSLEWADPSLTAATDGGSVPSPDASGPSIFTAVQKQLGLKLQPTKATIEGIVIDHIEKPSEN